MIVKNYMQQLKDKGDEIFRKTNIEKRIIKTNCEERSMECLRLGFNGWLVEIGNIYPEAVIIYGCLISNTSMNSDAAILLVTQGFYDKAIGCLRDLFDTFLTHLYFQILKRNKELPSYWINSKGDFIAGYEYYRVVNPKDKPDKALTLTNSYEQWSKGKRYRDKKSGKERNYPRLYEMFDYLFEQNQLDKYRGLREELEDFYSEKSKYPHGRPNKSYKKESSINSGILNIHYSSEDFDKFIDYLKRTYKYISIILLLFYPKLKETDEYKRFRKNFPKENTTYNF